MLAAVLVVGLGGCVAAVVAVSSSVEKAIDKLNAEQRAHAISKAQFDAVPLGASRAAVIQTLGKQPENTQEFVNKNVVDSSQINSSCIYYNREGEKFGSRFQFCFDGDSLRSKNAY